MLFQEAGFGSIPQASGLGTQLLRAEPGVRVIGLGNVFGLRETVKKEGEEQDARAKGSGLAHGTAGQWTTGPLTIPDSPLIFRPTFSFPLP